VLLLVLNLSDVTVPNRLRSILPSLPQALAQVLPGPARAAADLNQASEGLPGDFDLPAIQAAQRHYEQGLTWRKTNRLEQARQAFEWALGIRPDFAAAEQELRLMEEFAAGVERYQRADWAGAVTAFEPVYRKDAAYLYVDEILYSAYYNLAVVQQASGDLPAALTSYRAAIGILPEAPEARLKEEELTRKLSPLTSKAAVEKRIVVDISDQRTYMYEDDELVYEFVVSTGEPGQDTAIGEFKIQSKIPMAYAATWNLDMPYWLGIYWAGPLENGFHAVPTVRDTGETMWDGYLGQRVSYGCIILSLEDAETLYNWADLDTPVSIVP
jgi:lipoprotein-anchoring transpeptidase ErfK/SrfK